MTADYTNIDKSLLEPNIATKGYLASTWYIQTFTEGDSKKINWKTRTPSSVRYRRTMKLILAKETVETIISDVKNKLYESSDQIFHGIVYGKGKVCNAIPSCSSTQRCYLCDAKPSEMKNPDVISHKVVDQHLLSFELSSLDCRMRFFECLLHTTNGLEVQLW